MSLTTPDEIRIFQRKLYDKAKKEPEFRFYSLYDKVYRRDILEHAYLLSKAKRGAPGVDGVTFGDIEERGLEDWIKALEKDLCIRRYQPDAVRRVWIPKPGGGRRPLGIPTIRDRVAQTAAVLVLEPIFEADFSSQMYGYRRKRNAQDAVKEVRQALKQGYTDVVDADLSKYFDTIPHAELMTSVARRVSDAQMLKLIRTWLKMPVEERDEQGKWRRTQGKRHNRGTPQGGVVSPLLSNIYMNRFLKAWRSWEIGTKLSAKVIVFADDFVILCRGTAKQAYSLTSRIMEIMKLKLNQEKTKLKKATSESFDFLGYTFGPMVYRPAGRRYLGVSPSRRAAKQYRKKIRFILASQNQKPWEEVVKRVNSVTEGWARYFSYGTVTRIHWNLNAFLLHRARGFLTRRHKIPGRGIRQFKAEDIFNDDALLSFQLLKRKLASNALL
jgi:RNA-directed DNA polymerase